MLRANESSAWVACDTTLRYINTYAQIVAMSFVSGILVPLAVPELFVPFLDHVDRRRLCFCALVAQVSVDLATGRKRKPSGATVDVA